MLGDMLSGALSILGFLWIGSPAATELETVRPSSYPIFHVLSQVSRALFSSLQACFAESERIPMLRPCLLVQIVLDWLGKLLALPSDYLAFSEDGKRNKGGGVIQVILHSTFRCSARTRIDLTDSRHSLIEKWDSITFENFLK